MFSGVLPFCLAWLGSTAAWARRSRTTASWPFSAAMYSGVAPSSSAWLGSIAAWVSSSFTTASWPSPAAMSSAVKPPPTVLFTSTSAHASSTRTTSACPPRDARTRAGCPLVGSTPFTSTPGRRSSSFTATASPSAAARCRALHPSLPRLQPLLLLKPAEGDGEGRRRVLPGRDVVHAGQLRPRPLNRHVQVRGAVLSRHRAQKRRRARCWRGLKLRTKFYLGSKALTRTFMTSMTINMAAKHKLRNVDARALLTGVSCSGQCETVLLL